MAGEDYSQSPNKSSENEEKFLAVLLLFKYSQGNVTKGSLQVSEFRFLLDKPKRPDESLLLGKKITRVPALNIGKQQILQYNAFLFVVSVK